MAKHFPLLQSRYETPSLEEVVNSVNEEQRLLLWETKEKPKEVPKVVPAVSSAEPKHLQVKEIKMTTYKPQVS
jgi:hypothetical protein